MLTRTALRLHSLEEKTRNALGLRQRTPVQPFFLGVCGGSGSGKTTFCQQLVEILGADRVLHLRQDDYYLDLRHMGTEERARINFDHPDSVEFGLLSAHLDCLRAGCEIAVPQYDFATHTRTAVHQIESPKPIVLVEGILLFNDKEVVSRLHHKIFIEARDEVRYERRLHRDIRERGRTPEFVEWQYSATVRPMHDQFVESKKGLADRIISGEDSFEPAIFDLCVLLLRNAALTRLRH